MKVKQAGLAHMVAVRERIVALVGSCRRASRGASGVEYAILIAAIAAAFMAIAYALGPKVIAGFQSVDTSLPN